MEVTDSLTSEERRLQRALAFLTLLFAALMVGYLLQGFLADAEFPFVANSVAKDGLFAALCAAAWADVRRHGWAVAVVIGGHVLIVLALVAMLIGGNTSSVTGSFEGPAGIDVPSAETLIWIWLALATTVTVALALLYRAALRARHRLRYISPLHHSTITALAEVLVSDRVLSPEQVASNVDDYLYSFSAREKWKSRLALTALALYPLARLRPPFPIMSPERRRRFIERCFVADVSERRLPGFLRRPIQSMMFAGQQLVFIGYYSDPRTAASSGYVPFSERPRYPGPPTTQGRLGLVVHPPDEVDGDSVTADVAIVGSGAAGALLAHRLAEEGREVLVLERGKHEDPVTFTEDERSQFSRLYADGALQMSTDARFQVLQGMCVGGTTVVNNAVCFPLPDRVLERWNREDGLNAGLDEPKLRRSFARLEQWLPVLSQSNGVPLNPGAKKFANGVKALRLDQDADRFGVVKANIEGCLGCGYCNIGCPFGKKLSMLDNVLPRAQQQYGADSVRILSECAAERVETRNGRATGLRCRLSDGRELRVSAKTVVVSAGAIQSSLLLQRSGLGGGLAGKHLCFNMGAPMTAEFDEKLDSFDGLQISHYLRPPGVDSLILESWFNPVGAQSLFMPGWFSDHTRNMRRYAHMATVGSVVGTRRNASVRRGFLGRGMKLDYVPAEDDLRRLVGGLELIGRIFLEAGALRVMPPTYRYLSIESPDQLEQLGRHVRDNTDITLHSSHPQGGNAVSRDPEQGVVDSGFRVHGFDNLFVCDASVFPSATTVNPQLTVMALADYAADGVAAS